LIPSRRQLVGTHPRQRQFVGVFQMLNQQTDDVAVTALVHGFLAQAEEPLAAARGELDTFAEGREATLTFGELIILPDDSGEASPAYDTDLNWNRD
jgi:hypothetical protein